MHRLRTFLPVGLLLAFSGAHLALAQTSAVAHLAVQSGNGQVACICVSASLQKFQPISVKATDVNGNPVAGATVTWTNTSGQMTLGSPTTLTDGNGIATENISFAVQVLFTSETIPYWVFNIQASANNQSVTFTETQSLITNQGLSVISANSPTFNGANLGQATLTGNAGSSLTTPIITQVAGVNVASNGVGNASVRLYNLQATPTISCEYQGGYADPGSVLSDNRGATDCFPTFSGSGSGQFYVIIGGVPGSGDIANALDLQQFGPFNFTSIPGAPAQFQIISGNNQVGAIGAPLQPLVAKLVDSLGDPEVGMNVVWSVVPAGAVALSNSGNVTDSNGVVSQTVSLNVLASSGVTITVALASNPNISATFQETVQGAITTFSKISGDGQSAQVGTTFAAPLVVQVVNAAGPVANYPVQYISSGPVTLTSSTAGTDATGKASLTVKASNVPGTASVTAIAGALTQVFNLTVTSAPTGPTPNGISVVSGNMQSAQMGAAFSQALIVQVNSTSGPVSGYTVNFASTGPVTLSASSAVTNSSGQAQITATAQNTSGAATVTASITGYSATFSLNVAPPGPQITAASFMNAASRLTGQLAPCGLAIINAQGLTPDGTADYTLAPIVGRFPKTVHNLSVTFGGIAAPIVSVAQGATNPEVTVQVPCEVTPGGSVPAVVTVNGGASATVDIPINLASPGIFQQVMTDGLIRAVAVRSDGSYVDIGGSTQYDPNNPARLNETVRFYVTGLGVTNPPVASDTVEDPNSYCYNVQSEVGGKVSLTFVGTNIQLNDLTAHAAPGLIGVYEVDATIPSNAPTGNNVQFYISMTPTGTSTAINSQASTIPISQ